MSASKTLLLFTAVILGSAWTDNLSQAQELRRYVPSSPTISPYLELSRFNAGGLPNYYALVRPINRQRQINLENQRFQRQQSNELRELKREQMLRPMLNERAATGTAAQFLTNGNRAVYRETFQFYPTVKLR